MSAWAYIKAAAAAKWQLLTTVKWSVINTAWDLVIKFFKIYTTITFTTGIKKQTDKLITVFEQSSVVVDDVLQYLCLLYTSDAADE